VDEMGIANNPEPSCSSKKNVLCKPFFYTGLQVLWLSISVPGNSLENRNLCTKITPEAWVWMEQKTGT
jgi:hypothetical protein